MFSHTEKKSWFGRLRQSLSKTGLNIANVFTSIKVDENLFESLEEALLMADVGPETTYYLSSLLRQRARCERLKDGAQVKSALFELIVELLLPLESSFLVKKRPFVIMVVGANGTGKTTSIGKLAYYMQRYEKSVLLAAGDTFRAGAIQQLDIWAKRSQAALIHQEGKDPAGVIFDAVKAADARGIDVLIADTAGRLPNQFHLMEELRKIKRVITKATHELEGPHEILLVIDSSNGQNAFTQVQAFDDALSLSGLIITKLDSTAKGGILIAIARKRPIPVYFVGVGEQMEDLQPFSAVDFSKALLGI